MRRNHTTPTALFVLIAIAAVVAMLLAASTVAVASNHSAFAWKEKGYKKDRYQKDENKYQNDGSDSKYVMGSKRGSGNSITVIAANDQNNECKTSGNMSPIGTGACVNTGTATATTTPPTTGILLITKVCDPDCPGAVFQIVMGSENAQPHDFTLQSGQTQAVTLTGHHAIQERIPAGFGVPEFTGDCAGDISAGQTLHCTITNFPPA